MSLRKHNGIYDAEWSPALNMYIMDAMQGSHLIYSDVYEISEEAFNHFEDPGFHPEEHIKRFLFSSAGTRTPEQQRLYEIRLAELKGKAAGKDS
ncbi:MAG: hypothetical protein J5722_08595 [Oscillospiraceae bacterium]|nr:hypothetical protein [Oscillospiraceae bacterium]